MKIFSELSLILQKTFIKCQDPSKAQVSGQHDAVEQSITDPRRPRGACRDLRKHPQYRTFLKKSPDIIVNCQLSCSNGRNPCGRPDTSTCKFFCPSGQEALPAFSAVCRKTKGSRKWSLTPRPATLPKC